MSTPEAWQQALKNLSQRGGYVELARLWQGVKDQSCPVYRVRLLSFEGTGIVLEMPQQPAAARHLTRNTEVSLLAVDGDQCWALTSAISDILPYHLGPSDFVQSLELAWPRKAELAARRGDLWAGVENLGLPLLELTPIQPRPQMQQGEAGLPAAPPKSSYDSAFDAVLQSRIQPAEGKKKKSDAGHRSAASPTAAASTRPPAPSAAPAKPAAPATPGQRPDAPSAPAAAVDQPELEAVQAHLLNISVGGMGVKVADEEGEGQNQPLALFNRFHCRLRLPHFEHGIELQLRRAQLQRMQDGWYAGFAFEHADPAEKQRLGQEITRFVAYVEEQQKTRK